MELDFWSLPIVMLPFIATVMAALPTWTADMVACVTAMVDILATTAQCLLIALQKSIAVAMVPH